MSPSLRERGQLQMGERFHPNQAVVNWWAGWEVTHSTGGSLWTAIQLKKGLFSPTAVNDQCIFREQRGPVCLVSLPSFPERMLVTPIWGESHMGNHTAFRWQWACHAWRAEFHSGYCVYVVTQYKYTDQVQGHSSLPSGPHLSFSLRSCPWWGVNPLNLNGRREPITKAKLIEFSFKCEFWILNEVTWGQNSDMFDGDLFYPSVAAWIEVLRTPVVLVPALSWLWLELTTYFMWNLYIICRFHTRPLLPLRDDGHYLIESS